MAYQLYTKNQLGEIVAVTPGIDERVSNLETKAVETDLYKLDVREQTLTTEQKTQVVQNLAGTFLPLTGGTLSNGIAIAPYTDYVEIGYPPSLTYGGLISFRGSNFEANPGGFQIFARNGEGQLHDLEGRADGSLKWTNRLVEVVYGQGDGYIRYGSGLQICWGISTDVSSTVITITTPLPFATRSFSKVATPMWADIASTPLVSIIDDTATTFKVCKSKTESFILWIAIGRWK